jgi:gas vesicle protein
MRKYLMFLIGAVSGGLIGTFMGLLLAPSSGSSLREDLRSRFQALSEEVKTAAIQRREELEAQLIRLRNPEA